MSILNAQRNQKGIQTLGTEFQAAVAAGHGYMVYHTNGAVYCVFARNYLNGVQERRLYISYSSDGGNLWSSPTQLTSGNWDDNPCALQLDTSSTTSALGIVFTRAAKPDDTNDQVLHRIGVNQATFALTTPVDAITSSPAQFKFPSLVKTSTGYAIFAITSSYTSSTSVSMWTNASFTTNTWSLTTLASFWGVSTFNPFSLSVKRLANGHLGAISCVRTSLNGSNNTGVGNLPRGIVRTDVYTSFSSDDGSTWSSPQNLTNYSGTPSFDLAGLAVAFDADIVELSDGTVVVVYQEGNSPQYIDDGTTLSLPTGCGNVTSAVYHPDKNYLIVGTDDASNGGVFIFNLTSQTRTRLFTASTPALWGNSVQDLSLSSDNKYLAVAHTLGLEIIDTTDAAIANWTVTPIRTSTTPASRVANMKYCKFNTSGYLLYVAYGAQSISGVWGFLIDASSPTTVTDLSTNAGAVANAKFVVTPSTIYTLPVGGYTEQVNKTTGAITFSTNFSGGSWTGIVWDDVNSELVLAGTDGSTSGIHRVKVVGSVFVIQQSFGPSSNPAVPASIDGTTFIAIPGSGCYYHEGTSGALSEAFYSFGQQQPMGFVAMSRYDQALGENEYNSGFTCLRILKSSGWRFSGQNGTAQLIDLKNSGRLRYGFFPYDSGTHQLLTSGIDFYDMVNVTRVGNAATGLQKVRTAADASDQLYAYFRKVDFTGTPHQYAAMNGHVEPDAYKLFMRARILKTQTQTLQARGRIRTNPTKTINTKALIVFAQCLKMRAHITPFTVRTLTMRARINGRRTASITNTYLVSSARNTRLRMVFYAGQGQQTLQALGMGSRISKQRTARFTSHFIVYNNQSGQTALQFSTSQSTLQPLTVRARISRP